MKATARRRKATAIFALLGAVTLSAPGPLGEKPDGWARLQTMPPELRIHLAEQLKEFDLLGRAEQDAIRALDRKIAEEPAVNREAYDTVLRHFHLWLRSLPEAQQNELRGAEPSRRMALVSKIRGERPITETPTATAAIYPYADFGGVTPFALAQRIKVWLNLAEPEKAEILKLSDSDRVKRIDELANKATDRVHRPGAAELEEVSRKAAESPQYPTSKKPDSKRRFVNNYYFVVKPPAKVPPEKLLAFDRSLPIWIRSGFDTLPPEEARRRLTILYRLIYGENGEKEKVKENAKTKGKAEVREQQGTPSQPSSGGTRQTPAPF